jgi:hypothetical protein
VTTPQTDPQQIPAREVAAGQLLALARPARIAEVRTVDDDGEPQYVLVLDNGDETSPIDADAIVVVYPAAP